MSAGSKLLWTAATFAITGLILVVAFQSLSVREDPAYESIVDTFPSPGEAPPANLPGFSFGHPRLPAPSSSDIALLRSKNAGFIHGHIREAKAGRDQRTGVH